MRQKGSKWVHSGESYTQWYNAKMETRRKNMKSNLAILGILAGLCAIVFRKKVASHINWYNNFIGVKQWNQRLLEIILVIWGVGAILHALSCLLGYVKIL